MNKSRGIRGATTSKDNTKNSIIEATKELLEQMINSNLSKQMVIFIFLKFQDIMDLKNS